MVMRRDDEPRGPHAELHGEGGEDPEPEFGRGRFFAGGARCPYRAGGRTVSVDRKARWGHRAPPVWWKLLLCGGDRRKRRRVAAVQIRRRLHQFICSSRRRRGAGPRNSTSRWRW